MKRAICFCLAFLLTLIFNFGNYSSRAYSETPIIPMEKDAETYEAKIVDVPPADDPRWVLVPKEEMANHIQLLVDHQNSNYERIRTWSGSYYRIHRNDCTSTSGQSSSTAYALLEDLFTFACNVAEDKSFLRCERLCEQYYDKRGAETEPDNINFMSNVCGVLTKDQFIMYKFDTDQIRGELEGVMPGRIGKVCVSMPAEEQGFLLLELGRSLTRGSFLFLILAGTRFGIISKGRLPLGFEAKALKNYSSERLIDFPFGAEILRASSGIASSILKKTERFATNMCLTARATLIWSLPPNAITAFHS